MTNLLATFAAKILTDRTDAGRQPASALKRFKSVKPVVLALPRDGTPAAYEVTDALDNFWTWFWCARSGHPASEPVPACQTYEPAPDNASELARGSSLDPRR